MPEKHTFEYAVIRMVPRVEREEFINVGIVLYSRPARFLGVRYGIAEQRLQAFAVGVDVAEVLAYLEAFERICAGAIHSGPIGQLDLASRFRWLTATRSTVVQTSKVHPGMCAHPQAALEKLYKELVL